MSYYVVLYSCCIALLAQVSRGILDSDNEVERLQNSVKGHNKLVVCYWGTWANYRPARGKFVPHDIDASLCTHLIYSFVGLDAKNNTIKILDPWMDVDSPNEGYRHATELKRAYPHLKVSIAIGGWNEGSIKYSMMARDAKKRTKFVDSALKFVIRHNFDGLDLDWEYPGKRGGILDDKKNFVLLIRELASAFKKHQLILTAAIGAGAATIETAYDIPMLYKYLDYVHVMCYDYHGKWDRKTGHNAPLGEVIQTIEFLLENGAVMKKTIVGVPLYGRAFKLTNPHDHRVGAKSQTSSFQGPYTREDGFLGYNEICKELQEETEAEDGWLTEWDEEQSVGFMYNGVRWISFDDERSLTIKSELAYDKNLGGVMIWSIDTDDFNGDCGPKPYPLLRAINNALYRKEHRIESGVKSTKTNITFLSWMILIIIILNVI